MGVNIINNSSLKNILSMNFGDKYVFIKFGTDWCIPCQELDKILSQIPDSMTYHVNLDNTEFDDVMEDYNFKTIPYTIVKYNKKTANFSGILSSENIIELIQKVDN
jgi:thioredoxin-like negative regulator of GroEL